ncbi:hypothetical protein [Tenacibaculum sp. 190524A02b]|uniref:DUF4488 domain-containing protein n=1 Tax=Tenacibaculum vairaonense TaxID=3137860 RepID=A0ABM9PNW4_9FLAO
MKRLFSVLFMLMGFIASYAQSNTKFPEDFLGIYKGDLQIHSSKGKQTITMEFHLLETATEGKYEYKLVYSGNPRNYTLVVKDKEKGLFEVDENNGIVLPVKFVENSLYSFFEVGGSMLTTRLSFKDKLIDFEILFSATKNKTTTGKGTKEIPFVYGYPISVVQRAELKLIE